MMKIIKKEWVKILKKAISLLLSLLLVCFLCLPAFAASVNPALYSGNDSNPKDYTPPTGCTHYEIPGSGTAGTYTVSYNCQGQIDPTGSCKFTVTIGKKEGQSYTQVLSWSSTCSVYAVIVKGGDSFNLYQYPSTARDDTDLVSPTNASGKPADVSHVSIVICSCSCSSSTSSSSSSSSICPPSPCPADFFGVLIVFIIIAFFLIGIILGVILQCCNRHKC